NLPNRKSLHRLEMMNAKVTDEGVQALTGMTSLDHLRLDGNSKLTGVTLNLLADMKRLRFLGLSKTGLTNDGLKALPELPLKELLLSSTKITDEGLKELAKHKSARTLDLGGTPVTGAGLKDLADSKIVNVSLSGSLANDEGVSGIAAMKSVTTLNLSYTRVTDACIDELSRMKLLKALNLRETTITQA